MAASNPTRAAAVLVIACALASFLPAAAEDNEGPTLASLLAERWEKMRRSYAEVRWSYLPGLRMTAAKTHELYDVVLSEAMTDPWFARPGENLVFNPSTSYPEYRVPAELELHDPPPPRRSVSIRF